MGTFANVHSTPHRVLTEDGIALRVTLRTATSDPSICLVIQAALGTPQQRYAALASYLAERGFATVTYDYRDIGKNRQNSARTSQACVSLWGQKDQSAVLAWARARYPQSRLVVLGHSMGGQILGFTPYTKDLDGVVLVSAQSTYYRHWTGFARWKMLAFWALAWPGINRTLGYMPGLAFGGEDLPPGCTPEGTRWALRPSFIGDEPGVPENLAQLRCPILAYSFTDDAFHAPKAAVEAFLAMLSAAKVQHRHVAPADFALARIGHFGYFSSRAKPLWDELCASLQALNNFASFPFTQARGRTMHEDATHSASPAKARLGQILRRKAQKMATWQHKHPRMALRDVFADLVRFSRELDQRNPLTEAVHYRIYQDPMFGELPLVQLPARTAVKALPLALR